MAADGPDDDTRLHEYDIVVYGGTSAAVTAGVQASRMDRSDRHWIRANKY